MVKHLPTIALNLRQKKTRLLPGFVLGGILSLSIQLTK